MHIKDDLIFCDLDSWLIQIYNSSLLLNCGKKLQNNYFNNIIVNKPWGHEYLCYQNEDLAIWLLYIKNKAQTSFHCHPNKNTGFIVLSGEVELSFMRNKNRMTRLDKIHIFRSRFHSTKAISDQGAYVLEIETPEDKRDLVRLEDQYGREEAQYEGKNSEVPKNSSCIWISEPGGNISELLFDGCKIIHFYPKTKEELFSQEEKDCFVITRGGIETSAGQQVIWPGDILDGFSLERLLKTFGLVNGTTLIKISA